MKYITYGVITVVAIAVLAGFFVIGSPGDERSRRFDEQRVSDLSLIQNQLLNYWQAKGNLPESLGALQDTISGFSIPNDPDPGATSAYQYSVRGPDTFLLCAVFSTSNVNEVGIKPHPIDYRSWGDNWKHDIGKTCFERTIDKDLYKRQ